MGLSRDQERLSLILFASGADNILLAGGAGLIAQGIVERATDDLDGFVHSGHDFLQVADAAEQRLRDAGYEVLPDPKSLAHDDSQMRSWIVRRQRASRLGRQPKAIMVQIVRDHIVMPPAPSKYGYTIDPLELGANKITAIYDRSRARDFDDLSLAARRINLDAMMEVADMKQAQPIDRDMLAEQFRQVCRIPDSAFRQKRANADIEALRRWALGIADALSARESLAEVPLPPTSDDATADSPA